MDVDRDALLPLRLAPATAYRELLYRPAGELSGWIRGRFEIIARPGRAISGELRPGDLLLVVILGHPGVGECRVLADAPLTWHRSGGGAEPGYYCTVTGAASDQRRILDPYRRVPPGRLLLRPRPAVANDTDGGMASVDALGDSSEAVTAAEALRSPRFTGDADLEAVLRGNLRLAAPGTSAQPAPVRSAGPAIVKVQQALVDLGYALPRFGPDGHFGAESGSAVTKFKVDSGIQPSDPVVGRATMTALDEKILDHDRLAQPVAGTPSITVKDAVVVVRKPYTTPTRRRIELRATADFTGTGTFAVSKPDRVRFFDADTAGNPVANGAVFTAVQLQAGVVIFAEGTKPSDKVDDVVVSLSLSAGGKRGQSASKPMTAVELLLDLHASRTTTTTLPAALSTADKLNPGRFVHVQDIGFHHGRAMLTVRPTEPKDFAGKLVLEAPGVNPRVRFFAAADEVAAAGQASLGAKVASIPATGGRFWVEGVQVSGALRDVGLRLGVDGLEPDGDRAALTVVQFSNLQATIPGTPPRTARLANGPVAAHMFTVGANGFDEDPTVNLPLPLVEGSIVEADPVLLQVTVAPADTPVSWGAQRASGIAAASGGDDPPAVVALHAARAPTVRANHGNDRQATLLTDNSGTFHVRPFVDCNGDGRFDHKIDREPNIVLNLVLGQVTLRLDNSVARSTNFAVTPVAGGGITVRSGSFDLAAPNTAAIHLNAQIDVITGGMDGRRSINRFLGGWINNMTGPTTFSPTYTDATVAPPTVHPAPFVFASNSAAATGGNGSFRAGDPAPAIVAPLILDSGRPAVGTGGDSATLSRSRIRSRTNLAVGERWIVEAVDSPSRTGEPGTHPNRAAAQLTSFEMPIRFAATLAVWTNNATPPSSGPTGDPADRLYAVLLRVIWNMNGRWTVTPATGAITVATAPTTDIAGTAKTSPAVAAQTRPIEVRPPAAVPLLAQDARA